MHISWWSNPKRKIMRTATETYTGLPAGYTPSATATNTAFPLAQPPALPPLHPIAVRVTMDTTARLPSTWRNGIGKTLTNRRIAEYQREGRYGSGLLLPPVDDAKPCCQCKSTINTRQCGFEYLPKSGVYCKKCLAGWRVERDQKAELRKREQELFNQEYQ